MDNINSNLSGQHVVKIEPQTQHDLIDEGLQNIIKVESQDVVKKEEP